MFNADLLWYLLVPLFLSVGTVIGLHKFCHYLHLKQIVGYTAVGLLISSLFIVGAFAVGKGMKTADTEILNGYITGKQRDHGHYLRPYDCNCTWRETCSGSGSSRTCSSTRVCQTCYEDRYTVTWSCQSTVGPFTIEHLDRSSKSVYRTPDPQRYVSIQNGDPASRTNVYTNYIKAVPSSLFRPAQEMVRQQFANMLPSYPDRPHDFYRINRVLGAGVSIPSASKWNALLSEELKTLGAAHQVNAVVVFAKTGDENFFYALQDAWVNGKKNDVVLVVGVDDFNKAPLWVNVMALSRDNLFQTKLADRIRALDNLTPESVIPVLSQTIRSDYKRRPMADFKYLEVEIDPPAWLVWLTMLLIVGSYVGFWIHAARNLR